MVMVVVVVMKVVVTLPMVLLELGMSAARATGRMVVVIRRWR